MEVTVASTHRLTGIVAASSGARAQQESDTLAKLRELTGLQTVDEIADEYTRQGDDHVRAIKYYNLVHEEAR
jgi:hypothetical protein